MLKAATVKLEWPQSVHHVTANTCMHAALVAQRLLRIVEARPPICQSLNALFDAEHGVAQSVYRHFQKHCSSMHTDIQRYLPCRAVNTEVEVSQVWCNRNDTGG